MYKKFYLISSVLLLSTSVPALCSEEPNKRKDTEQERRTGNAEKTTPPKKGKPYDPNIGTPVDPEGITHLPTGQDKGSLPEVPTVNQSTTPASTKKGQRSPTLMTSGTISPTNKDSKDGDGEPAIVIASSEADILRYAREANQGIAKSFGCLRHCADVLHIPSAQYEMGMLCYNENLKLKDKPHSKYDPESSRAKQWFLSAALDSHVPSMNMVAVICIENGEYKDAISYLNKAIQKGDYPEALCNLAHMHHEGLGREQNLEKAIGFYDRASKRGIIRATYELAKIKLSQPDNMAMNLEGLQLLEQVCKQNDYLSEADKVIRKAATKQIDDFRYMLGMRYLNGTNGFPLDREKALQLFKKAAGNNKDAMLEYGRLLIPVDLNRESFKPAQSVLEAAAKQGHEGAKTLVAETLEQIKQLEIEAAKSPAQRKCEAAQKLLTDKDNRANLEQAVVLLRESKAEGWAAAGSVLPAALFMMGENYWTSPLTSPLRAQAIAAFAEASSSGHALARKLMIECHMTMGKSFLNGLEGLDINLEQAIHHLTKAAALGLSAAKGPLLQAKLGLAEQLCSKSDSMEDLLKVLDLLKGFDESHDQAQTIRVKAQRNLGLSCLTIAINEPANTKTFTATAMKYFEYAAKFGDAESNYQLGQIYCTQEKWSVAISCLDKARTLRHAQATTLLSEAQYRQAMQHFGDPDNRLATKKLPNYPEAIKLMEASAAGEFAAAIAMLPKVYYDYGMALYEGKNGAIRNHPQGITYLTKAAESGLPKAQCKLGLTIFHDDKDTLQKLVIAHDWLTKAAAQHEEEAIRMLPIVKVKLAEKHLATASRESFGSCLLFADQVLSDVNAKGKHRVAGDLKAKAQLGLARICLKSSEHAKTLEAEALLREAASVNAEAKKMLISSHYQLAQNYLAGLNGANRDPALATPFLLAPANAGNQIAQKQLAEAYLASNDPTKMPVVVALLEDLVQKDPSVAETLANAQLKLGKLYWSGKNGLPENLAVAKELFRKAAEFGLPQALYNYGVLLEGSDTQAAVDCWRRAAAKSHGSAQYAMAVVLDEGKYVPANAAESLRLSLMSQHPQANGLIRKHLKFNRSPAEAVIVKAEGPRFFESQSVLQDRCFPAMTQYLRQLHEAAPFFRSAPILTNMLEVSQAVLDSLPLQSQPAAIRVHALDGQRYVTLAPEHTDQAQRLCDMIQNAEPEKMEKGQIRALAQALLAQAQYGCSIGSGLDEAYYTKLAAQAAYNFPEIENLGVAKHWMRNLCAAYEQALNLLDGQRTGLESFFTGPERTKQKMLALFENAQRALEADKVWSDNTSSLLEGVTNEVHAIIKDTKVRNEACLAQPAYARVFKILDPEDLNK
jgi:TPR repeat protein